MPASSVRDCVPCATNGNRATAARVVSGLYAHAQVYNSRFKLYRVYVAQQCCVARRSDDVCPSRNLRIGICETNPLGWKAGMTLLPRSGCGRAGWVGAMAYLEMPYFSGKGE